MYQGQRNTLDTLMIRWTYFSNLATVMLPQTSIIQIFRKITKIFYFKKNVNQSKRVRMDKVFLGLAGLLHEISLGLRPREIPRSIPSSPWKTPSIPPLLLGLTQSQRARQKMPTSWWYDPS